MIEIKTFERGCLKSVKNILKEAFFRDGSDKQFNEWELAENILADKGFVEELCLVAVDSPDIIGYLLLSKAEIGAGTGLGPGPLAVKHENRKKGIGQLLMETGIYRAKKLKFPWIALIGGRYYERFGFIPAEPSGITISANHPGNRFLRLLFLNDNVPNDLHGQIRYCNVFYNSNGELL